MASIHKHPVYDTDLHLTIDPSTRSIKNESGKTVLMQNDHNSERFTFEIPRYVDGHDMSLCNVVEIHYNNIDSSDKSVQNADIYPVLDLQISPDSEEIVIGSWLISSNATTYSGSLNFIFRFACVDEETSEITYQWFSDVYTGLKVTKGIYNSDVLTQEDNTDVLEAWKKSIMDSVEPYFEELNKKIADANFNINIETGELEYESNTYEFQVNEETGNLEWEVKEND